MTWQSTGTAGSGGRSRGWARHKGAALTVAAVAALGGGLAACGSTGSTGSSGSTSSTSSTGSSPSADALVASSVKAMQGLSSVRATGRIRSSGQDITIDWVLTPSISQGSFTTTKGSFQIVTSGSTVYMQADSAFWQSQGSGAAAALLAGKWVTGIPAADSKDLVSSFNLKQLMGSLGSSGTFTNVGTSSVNGQQAVAIRSSDGSTGYVAATGTPYLLKVVSPNNGAEGSVTLSEFGTAPVPTVPTGAVDLNTLAG